MKQSRNNNMSTAAYLRMLVGAYLVYLGGSLIYDLIKGAAAHTLVTVPAALLFIGGGGFVALREWKNHRRSTEEETEEKDGTEEKEQ